jgi:hypothetical protein
VIPCTSQNRISPVRRWVRRSKLTRTTLPRGRAPLEGAEHVRQTVIDWNSHTTTTFRGYGMFQFATMVGLPKTWVSVCIAVAPTQAGMPSRGLAVPDGTTTSAQARSTRSSRVRLRTQQIVQGLTCRREALNGLMSHYYASQRPKVPSKCRLRSTTAWRHCRTLAHGIVIALDLRSERDATRTAQLQTEDAPRTSDDHDESGL